MPLRFSEFRAKISENNQLDELSQDTLDRYHKKAQKQYSQSADSKDFAANQKTRDKHSARFTKRHKGIGSVLKRDQAKKNPKFSMKPSAAARVTGGEKGSSMTTKKSSDLNKNYKVREDKRQED